MLQSQVNYWTLQENKRANRAQEALKGQELETQRQNARSNTLNALTNQGQLNVQKQKLQVDQQLADVQAVNALTQQHTAASQRMTAEANKQQAAVALQQLGLNETIADRNYEVGLKQAGAALLQATTAASRVDSEIAKNLASAEYTSKQADTHYWTAGAEFAKDASFAVSNLAGGLPKIAKGVGSLISEAVYNLRK